MTDGEITDEDHLLLLEEIESWMLPRVLVKLECSHFGFCMNGYGG